MAEIAGARERLEEASAWLREQIRTLAAHVTPGEDPDVSVPFDPLIVDWREPLQYQYRMSGRVDLPAERHELPVPARAAAFLRKEGWDTAEEIAESDSGRLTTVIASREGFRVSVRFEDAGVLYSGRTSMLALYTAEPFVRPAPVLTPEAVRRGYLLCCECVGPLAWPLCESLREDGGPMTWATYKCRCSHPRYRHEGSQFSGACTDDCLCAVFEAPSPGPAYGDPEPSTPEPDRTPHPACPLQDPDCLGFHDLGA
ncbi:hypothetical protein ACWY4P_48320 [Streptomyces sp. LZ34]